MSQEGLVRGLWSSLGALRGQLRDTVIGSTLNYVSDLLIYVADRIDEDKMYHVVSGCILLKRYESFLRERVAATDSEYDDKVLDEVFEAVDAILESEQD